MKAYEIQYLLPNGTTQVKQYTQEEYEYAINVFSNERFVKILRVTKL